MIKITKQELHQLYIIEGKKQKDIANIYNCSVAYISKKLQQFDLRKKIKEKYIGKKFGLLTPIELIGKDKYSHSVFKCVCECGNIAKIKGYCLSSENTRSCGCLFIKTSIEKCIKNTKHGLIKHPLYKIWKSIKSKCNYKKNLYYVGDQIQISEEWLDFQNFYNWAMYKWEKGLHISLIDNTKNYSSENCEFITKREITLISNKKRLQSRKDKGLVFDFDGKSINDLANDIGIHYITMQKRIKKYGYKTALSMGKHETEIEQTIENILKRHKINYKKQIIVENKKPDFVLPDYKIIIECDGLYWHSDSTQKDKNYHSDKRLIYIKNGYFPLFFREDEIINKLNIIESIILNKTNVNKRIYGRNCKINIVNKDQAKKFFNENHLMGKGRGTCLGLFYNDILYSCMQYINKKNYVDISRYCCLQNTTIVGGFSKLLKRLPEKNIQTFIDLRYGSGKYLLGLGFKLQTINISFKWTKNKSTYHRMKFPSNSGYKEGYSKIWDCGQAKYIKEIND